MQKETARADQAERINTELQEEHQAACDLARSKDQLLDLGQTEINHLRESLALATAQQEQQETRWDFYFSLVNTFCMKASANSVCWLFSLQ